MFRKLKITQISSTSVGDFLFVFGIGNDGKVYAWHSKSAEWKLHKDVEQTNE